MRAYKGLHKNDDGILSCHNMVYEPGKTYKHEGEIELCRRGFHACHELWQTWPFYPNNVETMYYEVDCGGDMIESKDGDGKFVCSEITLLKEIDMTDVARFDYAGNFRECFAVVKLDGKLNFINTEGKLLSERWFDDAWSFLEGLALVELDDKCNFINTDGKLLSEHWFDYAGYFREGFAKVKLNGKSNFINTEGKLLSEQWFDYALSFADSLAHVKLDGKWRKINTEGEFIEE